MSHNDTAAPPASTPAPGVTIRRLLGRDWPAYRALRLRSLADAPYAFGSSLALEESWRPELWMARLTAAETSGRDCPLIAEAVQGQDQASADASAAALGLVYAKCDAEQAGVVNLFQMWVAPEARGRGVAQALLQASVAWARSIGAQSVRLGVVCGNDAAARLYRRAGFRDVGAPEPLRPGSAALEQTMQLELGAAAPP
jgi:ribosomal protein S18 acetylase RimI-like enzyme